MELKDYQQKTLKNLRKYLDCLETAADKKRKLADLGMGDIEYDGLDVGWKEAFKERGVANPRTYLGRRNGLGEAIPHVCLKVPTGGGKTLLAAHSIDLIKTHYLKRKSMLVLWIVPSDAIYRQTLTALRTRESAYRQLLDRASGGRTLILQKQDRFSPTELQDQLAVLLLMLPSANRRDKETLKMFQDTSGFEDFFPPDDNLPANLKVLKEFPNLSCYGQGNEAIIMPSLGNTLRVLKPLVIIDEGHKAYSENAQDTIRSFNPSFVLELSATPNRDVSNILVSVSGRDLYQEQMIKLDLNVYNRPDWDWQGTLAAAIHKLDELQIRAQEHQANGGRYIRPISLIQVERTGKDQRKSGFIHAEDVREQLIKLGVSPEAIAIKSSESDGLENIDLLAEDCPIRFIITRSALQEGWDCPFAYILTILTNPMSKVSITQLVGRVLRQPYAKRSGIKELDESYIFCFRQKANEIIDSIRRGFDEDGLGDLSHRAYLVEEIKEIEVGIREQFQKFAGKVYLPRFVFNEGDKTRLPSYEMDILSRIDWTQAQVELSLTLGKLAQAVQTTGINYADENSVYGFPKAVGGATTEVELKIDYTFAAMQLADIVPNPWMAYDFAHKAIDKFLVENEYQEVAANLTLIISHLKHKLEEEKNRLARAAFDKLIEEKKIHFELNIEHGYLIPNSIKVKQRPDSRRLTRPDGTQLKLQFREFVLEEELNEDEQEVAVYLDRQEKLLLWWDRNYDRVGYSLQGWQKGRIYPDFVFTQRDPDDTEAYSKLVVLETKGRQLDNPDTAYKQSVMDLCNRLVEEWDTELGLKNNPNLKKVEFILAFHDDAKNKINESLQRV